MAKKKKNVRAAETRLSLKDLRDRAGLTQAQLAEAIGIKTTTVSHWETSGRFPRRASWPRVAEALGISVEELLRAA